MPNAPTLQTIADLLGASLIGDGTLPIAGLAHPADATPDALVVAFDKALHPLLDAHTMHAVALAQGQEALAATFKGAILVKRPRLAMAQLTAFFAPPPLQKVGIHPSAVVDASAVLGQNIGIGALCVVEAGAQLGDGTILHPHVTIGAQARIGKNGLLHSGVRVGAGVVVGDRVILHPNAVIGADGFSFVTPEPGSAETAKQSGANNVAAFNTQILRIYSLGAVVVGDDVEIGACTTIDRGTLTHTRIGNGTKMDNQVQIGHNVVLGENCLLCGNSGVAGSTVLGNRVVLAARVGIADHLKIGDDAVIMPASQVGSNVPAKAVYGGFPAMPRERFVEQTIQVARLKNMAKRMAVLEEMVKHLEK